MRHTFAPLSDVQSKLFSVIILLVFLLNPVISEAQNFNFSTSKLKGITINNPTSLQFGPDGRLYVSQQNGTIKVFTIRRDSANSYTATASEVISLINRIPNHDDNGDVNSSINTRQVTSLLVTGTAANPILYVTSSDSRIGGPSGDLNLDTNSSILSRLTKTSDGWDKTDLVRGFPRSEENHSTNGMQLDEKTNTMYLTVGGFTNAGAPSMNFAYLSEYAYSASIVSIDLTKIDALATKGTGNTKYKYDLPTVDDPTRENNADGSDKNDPFGGNDGLNQAKITADSPVQIHSTGYRNAYDLVITKTPGKARRMYTGDNGPNQGWGGGPDNEGSTGKVTNKYVDGEPGSSGPGINDPQVNNLDGFHYIGNLDTYVAGSYYAGHPNPIRANPSGAGLYTRSGDVGVWRSEKTGDNPLPKDWPPVPVSMANPIEGDYQTPGEADKSLLTFPTSTNGLVEYTASNFNNGLKGNILAACLNGTIYNISFNEAGTGVLNKKGDSKLNQDAAFASNFGSQPLDITAQGDGDVFPGSVWTATYGADAITIFEPTDFLSCSGQDSVTLDEDNDGYSNADEIDNKTNPCSAASKPADFDGDNLSDLNDDDDDNDGIKDNADYFAWDAKNGLETTLPVKYDLFNNDPGTGFFGLGFTGLMSNKKETNDYSNLYDEDNLIAGGAVGAFSIVSVSAGDALGNLNNQENAFQFGINVTSDTEPFTVQGRILSAYFNNKTPKDNQSQGMYIGTGDQDNYIRIALNANGGKGGIQVVYENAGVPVTTQMDLANALSSSNIDLFLAVNPALGTVQPKYALNGGTAVNAGPSIQVSGLLLTALQKSPALAVGIIATSNNATAFTATWDFINVTNDQVTAKGNWQTLTASSGIPIGREENAYVQVGNKFYLLGGRTIKAVQEYDPAKKTWMNKSEVPIELHHFQAVVMDGLIYVIGAFTGPYPHETPVSQIYIYNPATDKWIKGGIIPDNRARGAAAAVVYKNKIYVIGGILDGHWDGQVKWFDEYDPTTNTWKTLTDAPRTRDHFQASVANDKIFVAGGRRSSGITNEVFNLTVPEVDVYDFAAGKWSTLAESSNIPTPRAGAASVILGNELLLIGGESPQALAHNETEALNVNTNVWRKLADLKKGRHGSQAIENNNGIYVVTGASNQGGSGLLTTQEAFYLTDVTTPTGIALIQSLMNAPASVDFGQVAASSSSSEILTLSNTVGNQAIIISSVTKSGDKSFDYEAPFTLPFVIPAGGSVDIKVTFKPTTTNLESGSLVVKHSGNGGSTTILLSGQVAEIVANPASLYFFSQQAGTTSPAQTITLKNTASASRQISGITITGANKAEFAHNLTSAVTLNAGASKDIAVTFSPVALGARVAQLNISYSGNSTPVVIGLTGEGTDNPNQAPVAKAGADTTISSLDGSIILTGSGTDSDGTIEGYTWKQVSGPNTAVFSSKTVAKPTVSGLEVGTYVFSLTVKDNTGASSASNEVTITVDAITGTGQNGVDFVTEIFPNPVSEQFEIKVSDWKLVKSVTVINLSGQILFTSDNIKTLSRGITVKNYPAGLYLVQVKMSNHTVTTSRIMVVK